MLPFGSDCKCQLPRLLLLFHELSARDRYLEHRSMLPHVLKFTKCIDQSPRCCLRLANSSVAALFIASPSAPFE